MGLDLKPLINSSRPIGIEDLSGKVVAIDAFNTIYQFLATIRGPTGEYLTNSKGEITSHISGIFYRNVNLLMSDIKPVYVFDGKANALKTSELQRRKQAKAQAETKYMLAMEEGRLEDARKFSKRTSVLTDNMVEEAKMVLKLLGIPFVQAPSDGEAAAAALTQTGKAYAAASQDYDSILFGATLLVRNLAISGRRKIPNRDSYIEIEPEVIERAKVLEETNLTEEQLVDVGILIGTDFNPGGIPGIGPKTALKLIREFGSLEKIEKIKGELSSVPYQDIRDIFLRPEIPQDMEIRFGEVKRRELLDYLCVEKNFSTERINTIIEKLEKIIANRSQSLEKWFG